MLQEEWALWGVRMKNAQRCCCAFTVNSQDARLRSIHRRQHGVKVVCALYGNGRQLYNGHSALVQEAQYLWRRSSPPDRGNGRLPVVALAD